MGQTYALCCTFALTYRCDTIPDNLAGDPFDLLFEPSLLALCLKIMMLAVANGHKKVNRLLAHGANVDSQDNVSIKTFLTVLQ